MNKISTQQGPTSSAPTKKVSQRGRSHVRTRWIYTTKHASSGETRGVLGRRWSGYEPPLLSPTKKKFFDRRKISWLSPIDISRLIHRETQPPICPQNIPYFLTHISSQLPSPPPNKPSSRTSFPPNWQSRFSFFEAPPRGV